jgi:hypothetical protein
VVLPVRFRFDPVVVFLRLVILICILHSGISRVAGMVKIRDVAEILAKSDWH